MRAAYPDGYSHDRLPAPRRHANMAHIHARRFDVRGRGDIQDDLRQEVSSVMLDRAGLLVWPTRWRSFRSAAPRCSSPSTAIASATCSCSCWRFGVRDGRLDARGGFVADLHRVALERSAAGGAALHLRLPARADRARRAGARATRSARRASRGRWSRSSCAAPRSICSPATPSARSSSRARPRSPTS